MDSMTIIVTTITTCYLSYMWLLEKKKLNPVKRRSRRFYARLENLDRHIFGFYDTMFLSIKENEEEFFKFTRMTFPVYNELLKLLEKRLTRTKHCYTISTEPRLAITLSYLSQGVSHQYLGWSFKIGRATARVIVLDTCYMGNPFTNIFRKIIVLLAACDANYTFTMVDVGGFGSQSDGGVLGESGFGRKLFPCELGLSPDTELSNSAIKFSHFFVGDPAFPLKNNLMRPYPGKCLPLDKKICNYRISRVRVVIENAFGILVARWRILRPCLNCKPENAEKVVLACVVLHNFIKFHQHSSAKYCPPNYVDREDNLGNVIPSAWREEVSAVPKTLKFGSNNSARSAFILRDILKDYFINQGAIPRQNKIK